MSIVSIQSHVVYGYVGNKAAVYPLQSMGFDVLPVNTVQFSNHTGYGKWQGEVFSRDHIRQVIQGIEDIGVAHHCQAILSGYMGSQDICFEVLATAQRFKANNPHVIYLCDPVIGNAHCFVKPEVLEFFKNHLQADIITPNQFEAETLSGIAITDIASLKAAADYFHQRQIGIVVITGVKLAEVFGDELGVFISSQQGYHAIKTKEYPFLMPVNGTGDLFSAVFLGSYLQLQNELAALRQTVYLTEQVMSNTFNARSRELKVTSIHYDSLQPQYFPAVITL